MLIELGIVSKVKFLSLKHNTPSFFSVVFDTITENPKNLDAWSFLASTNKLKIYNHDLFTRSCDLCCGIDRLIC